MTAGVVAPHKVPALKAIAGSIAFAALGAVLTLLLGAAYVLLVRGPIPVAGEGFVPTPGDLLAQGAGMLIAFGLATWLIGGKVLGLTLRDLRWQPVGAGIRNLGRGVVLGAVPAMLALVLGAVLTEAEWTRDQGSLLDYAVQVTKTLAVLAPAALSEEIIFRGVPLVLIAAAFGRVPAIVAVSIVFGLAHAGNPNVTGIGLANIALAGVFLSVVFYAPGGIWTAFGAHLGWNGMLAALDAPVSGLPFAIPYLDYLTAGPVWLTGGRFGPEGGLLASLAIAVAIAVAARWARETHT